MIIECPKCNKKFQIDENLISSDGRLLQCGSCNHKWFFQLDQIDKKSEKKIEEELTINEDLDANIDISQKEKKDEVNKSIKYNSDIINDKKSFNYFNILIVIIISIIALIVIVDTFKYNLISLFPKIEFFLNNLYETIKDIKLFIIDLIK